MALHNNQTQPLMRRLKTFGNMRFIKLATSSTLIVKIEDT